MKPFSVLSNSIRQTPTFNRDLKRMITKRHYSFESIDVAVKAIYYQDKSYLIRHKDHQLKGSLKAFRELHIEDNWLLMYQRNNSGELILVLTRTGTHDELFN